MYSPCELISELSMIWQLHMFEGCWAVPAVDRLSVVLPRAYQGSTLELSTMYEHRCSP